MRPLPSGEPDLFALLEHSTAHGIHWDLLIERPGVEALATWRLAENPCEQSGPIAAERIADHRRHYLDYEGEIAGDRGTVRRVDRGEASIEQADPREWIVLLDGRFLRGRFAVHTLPDGTRFERIPA